MKTYIFYLAKRGCVGQTSVFGKGEMVKFSSKSIAVAASRRMFGGANIFNLVDAGDTIIRKLSSNPRYEYKIAKHYFKAERRKAIVRRV